MSNELGFKEESSNGENVCKENCPPPPIRLALAGLLIVALLSLSAVAAPRVLASDPITLTITDARILEGNRGLITVQASERIKDTLKLVFTTSDGTATVADGDYESWKHKGRMNKGNRSKSWFVQTASDDWNEGDESFYVNISFRKSKNYKAPEGYAIVDGQGEVVIVDDDQMGLPQPEAGSEREPRQLPALRASVYWSQLLATSAMQGGPTKYFPRVVIEWNNPNGVYKCVMVKRTTYDRVGNSTVEVGAEWVTGGDPSTSKSGCYAMTWPNAKQRAYDMDVQWGKTYRYTVYARTTPPDGTLSYNQVRNIVVEMPNCNRYRICGYKYFPVRR
jgi:hypothetical protein